EKPDQYLLDRHWHDIFPLIKKRYLFAGVEDFLFYDVWSNGYVNDNVFAYSNRAGNESAIVFYNNKYDRADGWIKVSCPYAVKTGSGENDKQQVTRTLGEGLGLTRGDDMFMIFQEQRSGLWYIRKNNEIIDHGMYTSLNGFESQVFWNIREEKDDEEGKWSTLCTFLNGRGTPDMEIAWQEYHYRELYDALKPLITADLVNQVHALLLTAKERKAEKIKTPTVRAILAAMEEKALHFYEVANQFAEREHFGKKKAKVLPPAAKLFAQFKKEMTAIVKAVPKLTKPLGEQDYEKLIAKLSKATTAADYLYAGALAHNEGLLLLICYALVGKIAEAGLARRWAFDRKFYEFLKEAGAGEQHVWNFLSRTFALAAEKQPTLTGKQTEKDAAYLIASRLTQGKDAWLLTEAHWFDNVAWFNKELTDSSLFLAIAIPLLSSAKAKQEKLLALYKVLAKAKDKAAYHCDAFVLSFAPKVVKAKKSVAGKSTKASAKKPATKATAKKPAAKKKK
ncbi:MAG: alpha-amylase, partial [Treponema sp.]|nr:alpha-amylase [Treponema sp.]